MLPLWFAPSPAPGQISSGGHARGMPMAAGTTFAAWTGEAGVGSRHRDAVAGRKSAIAAEMWWFDAIRAVCSYLRRLQQLRSLEGARIRGSVRFARVEHVQNRT